MNHIINLRNIFKVVSRNLFIIGIAMLSCIGVALYYSEDIIPFLIPALIAFVIGAVSYFFSPGFKDQQQLKKKDTYFTVTLSWLLIGLIGCLPYIFSVS